MFRFCVDFRYLNSQSQDFCNAIPGVHELTESFFSRDTQLPFICRYVYRVLSDKNFKVINLIYCIQHMLWNLQFFMASNGVKTSPISFQLLMGRSLNGLSFRSTLCYLDDILFFFKTCGQYMHDLQEVVSALVKQV